MLTMEVVRAAYPNPVESRCFGDGTYCVGGAFLAVLDNEPASMSHMLSLAAGLEEANPVLGRIRSAREGFDRSFLRRSHDFAIEINKANDRGDFEAAWAALDAALRFPEEPS